MKYTSKVNYANNNRTSLKAVIPYEIADKLNLSANDILKWTVKDDGEVIVEKLIL